MQLGIQREHIGLILLGIALTFIWLTFAPQPVGGGADYVITSGVSMEPLIHKGDLVVLKESDAYAVGDVIGYHNPQIGTVLHRIIDIDGDRFTTQGDNNNYIDEYQPRQEEVVGEMWIHIPGLGKWLDRARQPLPMMLMAALAGFLIVAPRRAVRQLRQRAHRPPAQRRPERSQPPRKAKGGPAGILGPDGQTAISVIALVAIASLLLALLAFSQRTERQTTSFIDYRQSGTFSYSAPASGDVYEDGMVRSGQPVYLELVDAIDLSFDYALTADQPATVSGSYRIDAVVAYDEGLTRTIPLVPETAFEGKAFTASTTLALNDAEQYINRVAREIGAEGQSSRDHRLSIIPTVKLSGTIGNQKIQDVFAPALDFQFDEVALRLDSSDARSAAGENQPSNPLQPIQSGLIERPSLEASTFSFLMLDVRVSTARQIAVIGLLLSALAGAGMTWLYAAAQRAAESRKIEARYGALLVKVNGSDLGVYDLDGHIVEVASIEDLARVAEREGRMILHQQQGDRHEYFVQDVDVTYCYSITDETQVHSRNIAEAEPSI